MANFVTTETNVIRNAGDSPATIRVYGTYLSSAGATGGAIAPGYTLTGGTYTAGSNPASLGARTIVNVTITPTLSDTAVAGGVVSYNTTLDRDVFTLISVADTGGIYMLECLDNGN